MTHELLELDLPGVAQQPVRRALLTPYLRAGLEKTDSLSPDELWRSRR